jgi:hypothetical protein
MVVLVLAEVGGGDGIEGGAWNISVSRGWRVLCREVGDTRLRLSPKTRHGLGLR